MEYYDYYSSYPSYYDYYDYGYATEASAFTALGAVLGAFLGVIMVVGFVIAILQLAGMWKVFTKAGEKGWKCIIPIYNLVILFRISGLSPWIIFGYLAGIIPFIGWIVCLGISIYHSNSLAKSFGKDFEPAPAIKQRYPPLFGIKSARPSHALDEAEPSRHKKQAFVFDKPLNLEMESRPTGKKDD